MHWQIIWAFFKMKIFKNLMNAKTLLKKEPLLIDDFNKKLEKWTNAGGIGVLHNDSTDTIRVLEEIFTKND